MAEIDHPVRGWWFSADRNLANGDSRPVVLHSQALIECAAGGNGFDEMVRDVTADALEATK